MTRTKAIAAALALAGALSLGAASSSAQDGSISVQLTPNVAGKSSRATLRASGSASELGGQVPESLSAFVQRGFRFDRRARARTCGAGDCPAASRIGGGEAIVSASGPLLGPTPRRFTVALTAYLARPRAGEVAGVILTAGEPSTGTARRVRGSVLRRSGAFAYELRFSDFPEPPSFPGVAVTLESLRLDIGARRRVTRRVRGRSRRVTYNLITNPRACRGSWRGRVTFRVGGAERVRDLTTPCRRR